MHEPISQIHSIGRRQLIGYWRRHEHESQKTRMEKYHILVRFFASNRLTASVRVPKPKQLHALEFKIVPRVNPLIN